MDEASYRHELEALREENESLRSAARTFGELAERLAIELRRLRAQSDPRAKQARMRDITPRVSSGAPADQMSRASGGRVPGRDHSHARARRA